MTFTAAVSGMTVAQQMLRVVTHNLANARSAGFKEGEPISATLDSIDYGGVGSVSSSTGTIIPSGTQIGLGARLQAVTHNLKTGIFRETDDPYHVMIEGGGYFQLQLPSGDIAYTRNGVFTLNNTGQLVSQNGYVVNPGITVPSNAISTTIAANGEVSVMLPGQPTPQILGQIQLASFANPGGLLSTDNTLFMETQASGAPIVGNPAQDNYGKLLQYYYEDSNVNVVIAVTQLMEIQRLFEECTKAAKTENEMLAEIKNI